MIRHGACDSTSGGLVGSGPYGGPRYCFALRFENASSYRWYNWVDDKFFPRDTAASLHEVLLNYSNSPSAFGWTAYVNGVSKSSFAPYPFSPTGVPPAENATVGVGLNGDVYALAIRRGSPMTQAELDAAKWLS